MRSCVERGGELGLLAEQGSKLLGREGAGSVAVVAGEFGLAGEGGSVDPAAGDGVGEDVEGGVFAGGDDVGVVVVAASGHGDVDAADVGGAVEERMDRSTVRPWVAWLVWA